MAAQKAFEVRVDDLLDVGFRILPRDGDLSDARGRGRSSVHALRQSLFLGRADTRDRSCPGERLGPSPGLSRGRLRFRGVVAPRGAVV